MRLKMNKNMKPWIPDKSNQPHADEQKMKQLMEVDVRKRWTQPKAMSFQCNLIAKTSCDRWNDLFPHV